MAAKSNHYMDVYNWIIDVINSCETVSQKNSAYRLITQFRRIYGITGVFDNDILIAGLTHQLTSYWLDKEL